MWLKVEGSTYGSTGRWTADIQNDGGRSKDNNGLLSGKDILH